MTVSTHENASAVNRFFDLGVQYYLAGRISAKLGLRYAAAQNIHSGIELLLKGKLLEHHTLKELQDKFVHSLMKLWKSFESQYPEEELSEFKSLISQVDQLQQLRYAKTILQDGGETLQISFSSRRTYFPKNPLGHRKFVLSIWGTDRLLRTLFRLYQLCPTHFLHGAALEEPSTFYPEK